MPDGFAVQVFASGFKQPRRLRVAPNGDIFLAERPAAVAVTLDGALLVADDANGAIFRVTSK